MSAKREHIVKKTKTLSCGHQQTFSTPVPVAGNMVWCRTCRMDAIIPSRKTKTVAQGRPRRLKANPRSNNQYTKGRALS